MTLLAAFISRDWRIARTHTAPFVLETLSAFVAAALFYYLGRNVTSPHRQGLFAFAVAGLALLRVHSAVPRILEAARGELGAGTLELELSSSQPPPLVLLAGAAFELLRGVVMAGLLMVLAVVVFGAPFSATPAGFAGVALGLAGAAVTFAGLATCALGVLMVARQAGALGALSVTLMPVLGGAYFPVAVLPQPFHAIAAALPFRRCVDVMRDGMLDGRLPAGPAVVLALEAAALLGIGLVAAHLGVERARRAGTLGLD